MPPLGFDSYRPKRGQEEAPDVRVARKHPALSAPVGNLGRPSDRPRSCKDAGEVQ